MRVTTGEVSVPRDRGKCWYVNKEIAMMSRKTVLQILCGIVLAVGSIFLCDLPGNCTTITEGVVPRPPVVNIKAIDSSTTENQGSAVFHITRHGGPLIKLKLNISVSGTATRNRDYEIFQMAPEVYGTLFEKRTSSKYILGAFRIR